MAGYSGTPLPQKLGIRSGMRVVLLGAPDGLGLDPLPDEVHLTRTAPRATVDVIVYFATDPARLRKQFGPLSKAIAPAGALWIAWRKKASGLATPFGERDVRAIGLAAGLVDVKVCAVDATWSGLKFVVRKADRASGA